jgi:hypothetical protein
MKISFNKAFDMLMAADIVQVAEMGQRESVLIWISGDECKDHFTVEWESANVSYDVVKHQNVKVEKSKNRLTFISCEDTDNEPLEMFLYKQVPLLK